MLVAVLLTVSTIGTESQELENLRAFTKLYGYVKYFHPTDEASQIDWDRFAIYGAERVKDAQNSEGLRAALQELFLGHPANGEVGGALAIEIRSNPVYFCSGILLKDIYQ